MPKRSNDFQRLIKRIYEQLAASGAVVTESAMLTDSATGEEREVDVLIEIPMAGADSPTRVAIECRDHSRPGDKAWIDSLIGKYRDLPIDRVFAVSRKAFTAGAVRKARQCRIETRTLADALEHEWPADFFQVDFSRVSHWPDIANTSVAADPPWTRGDQPVHIRIGDQTIERIGFTAWQRKQMSQAFAVASSRQRAGGISQFDKAGTYPFAVTLERLDLLTPVVLTAPDGVEHKVIELTISGSVTVKSQVLPTSRYRFGTVGVTRVQTLGDGSAMEVLAVQEKGEGLSVRVIHNTKLR